MEFNVWNGGTSPGSSTWCVLGMTTAKVILERPYEPNKTIRQSSSVTREFTLKKQRRVWIQVEWDIVLINIVIMFLLCCGGKRDYRKQSGQPTTPLGLRRQARKPKQIGKKQLWNDFGCRRRNATGAGCNGGQIEFNVWWVVLFLFMIIYWI